MPLADQHLTAKVGTLPISPDGKSFLTLKIYEGTAKVSGWVFNVAPGAPGKHLLVSTNNIKNVVMDVANTVGIKDATTITITAERPNDIAQHPLHVAYVLYYAEAGAAAIMQDQPS